ncbi:MAG TPA: prepilin-type N-terminal cleavage/methylation domain-containing protein [Gemmatimonadaceae bacterium]|jgi:type IV pilus assembly protein PilA|nr:prepilin-type N-terminal cleavage/methylation domain-containing protein [Gemmatimonadaceae bacterium]
MKRTVKGFTLIELLIVVVIIGILAAIAIPRFAATKQNAYLATVKTDLRNLATAQEGYASSHNGAYMPTGSATNPLAGGGTAYNNYLPSAGVTVTITNVGAGWSATAVHASIPSTGYPGGQSKCAIYVNTTAVAPANNEGTSAC